MGYKQNTVHDETGVTMLETVVAMGIYMIVTAWISTLLLMATDMSGKLMVSQELLENARIAMDFMAANIAMSEDIRYKKSSDGMLRELRMTEIGSGGTLHTYIYQYDSSLTRDHLRYHRLEMGGNELASYIALVRLDIDAGHETATIHIKTDSKLHYSDKIAVEPIELIQKVKIKHKKITFL